MMKMKEQTAITLLNDFKENILMNVENITDNWSDKTRTYQLVIPIHLLIRNALNEARSINLVYTDLVHLLELAPESETYLLTERLQTVLKLRKAYKSFLYEVLDHKEYDNFYSTMYINGANHIYAFAHSLKILETSLNVVLSPDCGNTKALQKKIDWEVKEISRKIQTMEMNMTYTRLYTLRSTKYEGSIIGYKDYSYLITDLFDNLTFKEHFPTIRERN